MTFKVLWYISREGDRKTWSSYINGGLNFESNGTPFLGALGSLIYFGEFILYDMIGLVTCARNLSSNEKECFLSSGINYLLFTRDNDEIEIAYAENSRILGSEQETHPVHWDPIHKTKWENRAFVRKKINVRLDEFSMAVLRDSTRFLDYLISKSSNLKSDADVNRLENVIRELESKLKERGPARPAADVR